MYGIPEHLVGRDAQLLKRAVWRLVTGGYYFKAQAELLSVHFDTATTDLHTFASRNRSRLNTGTVYWIFGIHRMMNL